MSYNKQTAVQNFALKIKFLVRLFGLGTLPGKKLDLGLLKIFFFLLFLAHAMGSNPVGQYSNTFSNAVRQS